MSHLFIKYIMREDQHVDPNFTHLTYGDTAKASQLRNATPGSYVFFHTSYEGAPYITAFFYVERLLTREHHSDEINSLSTSASTDEVVILGSRSFSKILTRPLKVDAEVVAQLPSLNVDPEEAVTRNSSFLRIFSDHTRQHSTLTETEVEWLLSQCRSRG